MPFLGYKHLLFSYLLIHFTVTNQKSVEPPTLMAPNFDALLPFGIGRGRFSSICSGYESDAGATFTMLNNCSFSVWAAVIPGGGKRLDSSQAWILNVPSRTTQGRVWGRTNCTFDSSGRGRCETGDCGGVLQCQTFGSPPNTIAEFALDQINDLDFFDISLVDGFNIPMEFRPTSNGCSRGVRCAADIKGQCPTELRAPGGCNNPCTVFQTAEYCCNSDSRRCGPTNYSKYFKDRCPNAYSYPLDDGNATFTCPAGTNYDVVFCPS